MCLETDFIKTDKLRHSGKEVVVRYKLIRVETWPTGHIDVASIYNNHYKWKPGINKAEGKHCGRLLLAQFMYLFIDKTHWIFDVFVSVIEVQCNIKDLVAVGIFKSCIEFESEAYTQVYVDKLPE